MSYIPPDGHAVHLVFVSGYTPSATLNFQGAGRHVTLEAALGAAVQATWTLQGSLGAAVSKTLLVEASMDAVISPPVLQALIDGVVAALRGTQVDADAALTKTLAAEASIDAVLSPLGLQALIDGVVAVLRSVQAGADAAVTVPVTRQAQADAGLCFGQSLDASADTATTALRAVTAATDAATIAERLLAAVLDVGVFAESETLALSALLDAAVVRRVAAVAGIDAAAWRARVLSAYAETAVVRLRGLSAAVDAGIIQVAEQHRTLTASVSAWCRLHRLLAVFPDTVLLRQETLERTLRARLDALIEPGDDMSLSFSTGLRNHLLGYYSRNDGDGLGGAMHNCFIDVYRGEKPASPDYPPLHGTYLGTFQLSENPYNNEWGGSWTEPVNGSIRKQTWQNWVMQALASGNPGWFRMRLIDDLNDYSTTARRIDGTVGPTYGEFDMVMKNSPVVEGSSYRIDAFVMTMRREN